MSLIGVVLLAVSTFALLLLVFLLNYVVSVLLRRRRGLYKRERFEAGNPPIGPAKSKLVVQYFGYVYVIVVLECIFLILLLLGLGGLTPCFVMVLVVTAVVSVLTLILAVRYSSEVKEWT